MSPLRFMHVMFQKPARTTTLALPLVLTFVTSCCTCPPCPTVPADEPLVQGTMRIDTTTRVAELMLQIGGNPPLPADWEGQVDLWVGPDPAAGSRDRPARPWDLVRETEWETFEVSGMPWTNPPRSRAWRIGGSNTTDVLVAARLRPKAKRAQNTDPMFVGEYFEVRDPGYSWGFTAELVRGPDLPVRVDQAVIGGKPGSDDAPLVGVVNHSTGQNRFTFEGAQLQGPTHGWRPLRVWFWRLESNSPPAWEDRSMNVADAFWQEASVPPLPQDFPTAANPVLIENLTADPTQRYWFYAIIEEHKDGVTRYHAHRSAESRSGAVSPKSPLRMLESPDGDTTSNGPAGRILMAHSHSVSGKR